MLYRYRLWRDQIAIRKKYLTDSRVFPARALTDLSVADKLEALRNPSLGQAVLT